MYCLTSALTLHPAETHPDDPGQADPCREELEPRLPALTWDVERKERGGAAAAQDKQRS